MGLISRVSSRTYRMLSRAARQICRRQSKRLISTSHFRLNDSTAPKNVEDVPTKEEPTIVKYPTSDLILGKTGHFYRDHIQSGLQQVQNITYIKDTSDLAYVIDQFDAMTERKWPISSLIMDRFINCCDDVYKWKFSKYYMYIFRHSVCNRYLRPWTLCSWLDKGLNLETEVWGSDNIKDILYMYSYKSQTLVDNYTTSLIALNSVLDYCDFKKIFESEIGEVQEPETPDPEDQDAEPPKPANFSPSLSEKFESLSHEFENFNPDSQNKQKLSLRDIGGILQQLGFCLNQPKIQQAGQAILKIVENNLLENNKFNYMFMKPHAPERHVPGRLGDQDLSPEEILAIIDLGKNEYQQFLKNNQTEIMNKIQKTLENDTQIFNSWITKKEHLSKREAIIVDFRVAHLYKQKLQHKIEVESSVKEIDKQSLWLSASAEEMATHGRAQGATPDSKLVFDEFANPETRQEHMSAYAIHDIDLEMPLDREIRVFDSIDGNVELFLTYEFSDSPVADEKAASIFPTLADMRSHLAFRTKKTWLKDVPQGVNRPGVWNLDFATVTSKK